jgi:hypothetical protein
MAIILVQRVKLEPMEGDTRAGFSTLVGLP